VIDASAGIKLFIEEPLSDQAHALFQRLAADPAAEFFVPDLFFIECANVLLKTMRRFGRSLQDTQADLADLRLLALTSTDTVELMEDALELANALDLSAFNACYAVLARRLGVPLVTADQKIKQAVTWAVWLGDF
jgi:predicted nucleic acid-binding protein